MFKKPSVNKSVNSLNKLKLYIRAISKFGKSTLFRDMVLEEYGGNPEKGLLVGVGNEYGYALLDNLNVSHIESWNDAIELKKYLIAGKVRGEHEIELIAFDTLDELIPLCEQYVCELSEKRTGKPCDTINGALGGFGKGAEKVKELIKEYVTSLSKAGFGLVFIAHTKVKTIVEKGMNSDEGYMQLTSNLTNAYENSISAVFDVICTGVIDKKVDDGKLEGTERRLYFRGDGFVEAGGRFKSNSVPEYIVFKEDEKANAKLFVETLKEAIKGSKSTPITDEEFEKLAKKEDEEAKENAKEVLVEEERKERPSKEELLVQVKDIIKKDGSKKGALLKKVKGLGKKSLIELTEDELVDIVETL